MPQPNRIKIGCIVDYDPPTGPAEPGIQLDNGKALAAGQTIQIEGEDTIVEKIIPAPFKSVKLGSVTDAMGSDTVFDLGLSYIDIKEGDSVYLV